MAATDETGPTAQQPTMPGAPPPAGPPVDPTARPGARMPRWLPRAMVLALALIAVFQLGSWAFHQLTGLLLNILIAFFLALAVEPAVSWMSVSCVSRPMRHRGASCCARLRATRCGWS